MAAKKSTEIVPTMLRIREDLRKRLEREAKKNECSLNAEMVGRLEQSFVRHEQSVRDSEVLAMLLGDNPASAALLHHVLGELKDRPYWSHTDADIKDMAERISKWALREPTRQGIERSAQRRRKAKEEQEVPHKEDGE